MLSESLVGKRVAIALAALSVSCTVAGAALIVPITTGNGSGADAQTQLDSTPSNENNQSGTNYGTTTTLKLHYWTGDGSKNLGFKTYLRFDLNAPNPDIVPTEITAATLKLTLALAHPSTTTTYSLWGLNNGYAGVDQSSPLNGTTTDDIDIHGEAWSESLIDNASAPANAFSSSGDATTFANQTKGYTTDATLLGTFVIAGSTAAGTTIEINGSTSFTGSTALINFLKTDTNGLVTLMLARETSYSGNTEFASDEHATYDPPTLTLTVPEPASASLLALGGLGLLRRWRN